MTPLDRAIERFGGDARWRALRCVTLRAVELGGPLPRLKGLGVTFPRPDVVRVYPHERRVEFEGLGTFHDGAVDGQAHHRPTFAGLRKYRRWSAADAVYFFGYALTTYLGMPFLLRDLSTSTRETRRGHRIDATFPPAFHTHGPRQRFFFDATGLLVRHDYVADVVGWWAAGAHFTSDYQVVKGLPIATRRAVFARLGPLVTPLLVLRARLEPVAVT